MRTLSSDMVQDMFAAQTGAVYLHIVKISHADLGSDLFFVDNEEDVVYDSDTYVGAAFRIKLPEENDDIPSIQLQIDNVDQTIIEALRSLQTAPTVEVSVIRGYDSSVNLEVGPYEVSLQQFDYDKFMITGTLGYDEDFLNEQFPKDQFTPQSSPGIF